MDQVGRPMNQRLRISFQDQEIELEGSTDFVERWAPELRSWLAGSASDTSLSSKPKPTNSTPVTTSISDTAAHLPDREAAVNGTPSGFSFGEFMHQFPRQVTDVDRMLIAGLYVQRHTQDDCFSTASANSLLLDQGFKVGNASQSVKQNVTARRAFRVTNGRYRVSSEGEDYLKRLGGDHPIYRG